MSDLRTAAQQALEALRGYRREMSCHQPCDAEVALEAALEQPVQEPVAWQWLDTAHFRKKIPADATPSHWRPLYIAPPQRKPLTEEEIYEMYNEPRSDAEMVAFARAVERAHGIGGQDE